MKVGILAGGAGSRLAEDTAIRPKPMIEIGGRPILWHIMMHYAFFGFREFVIALGYKGEVIKKYLVDFCRLTGNLSVDFSRRQVTPHPLPLSPAGTMGEGAHELDWKVDLVETGSATLTGGRIKRLAPFLGNGTFLLTWGDAVCNVDLRQLLDFHRSHGKLATLTAVRPPARYGHLRFAAFPWPPGGDVEAATGRQVIEFSEKPQTAEGWINGAYFVLEPGVFDYIDGDDTQWEREPLERLARDGQLVAFQHDSFWQCMDTLRDKHVLESLWEKGDPPWKLWS
jgi:glucose-1-phosphate cytidylyltransferase